MNLESDNPEADETVNVFLAASRTLEQIDEFEFTLSVEAEDFEALSTVQEQGIIYVADENWTNNGLFFLPLNDDLTSTASPRPLTDAVIKNPRRPSASSNGRFVIFDSESYKDPQMKQRIHLLDLFRGTVRRLTVDKYGNSYDRSASMSADGSRFAFITNRRFETHLVVESVDKGLGGGFGNEIEPASDADWSHTRNEIVFVDAEGEYSKRDLQDPY